MCGIIGSINLEMDSTILADITHRGPDDHGWTEHRISGHRILLGHTRLAIQDTSHLGHQPMSSKEGVLIFNGEIYNHRELRGHAPEYHFSGHSDTETLLALLGRDPRRAIPSLNGIFAFAYLDLHHGRLLLARDPFGVKPMYYASIGNSVVFSSEIRPLLRSTGNEVDLDSLALALRYRSSYAPNTIYRNIRKLAPGTCLEIDLRSKGPAIFTWSFVTPYRDDSKISKIEAVETYKEKIKTAIERQLLSDVEIGIFLSGGVDSALIASGLSQLLTYRPKAFTVGFDAGPESEIDEAAVTAKHTGLEHHTLKIRRKDFFTMFAEAARAVEEPTSTTSIVPLYALARLASQHVHVVLSGQGADECNAGYSRYRAELLANLVTLAAARTARSLGGRRLRSHKLLSYLSHRNDFHRYLSSHEVFSQDEVEKLLGSPGPASFRPAEYDHELSDPLNRIIRYDLQYNLPDDLLLYTDKISMRFSLECRVPFLDHELVSFLMSLPGKFKANLSGGKLLHKEVARLSLPNFLVQRKKKGFLVPTQAWFRDSREHWDTLLDRQGIFDSFFDRSYIESMLERHRKGENLEKKIMLLMSCRAIMDSD